MTNIIPEGTTGNPSLVGPPSLSSPHPISHLESTGASSNQSLNHPTRYQGNSFRSTYRIIPHEDNDEGRHSRSPRPMTPTDLTDDMVISAYSMLTPKSKSRVDKVLDTARKVVDPVVDGPSDASLSSRSYIYMPEDEKIIMSDTHFDIHSAILDLARNSVHLPLTLFTAASTVKLVHEDSILKKVVIYHRDTSAKMRLLDVSEFPKEAEMDISDWHEAWSRFGYFLRQSCHPNIATRWIEHYQFLSSQHDFKGNFEAILKFDIEQRTRYFTARNTRTPDDYTRRFEQIKNIVLKERLDKKDELEKEKEKIRLNGDRSFHSFRPNRLQPYPREKPRSLNEYDKSFRPSPRSDSSPICFICRGEHRFSKCDETKTTDGKPTYAKRLDGRIVKRNGGDPICYIFNASTRKCDRQHSDLHVCSLCGSSDHGACTCKCQ